MTNEKQIIEELQPFLNRITSSPLPSIPGVGGRFYLQIQQIRVEAVTEICWSLLARTQHRLGDAAAEELRRELDPIRVQLLAEFPELLELLGASTWPNLRRY